MTIEWIFIGIAYLLLAVVVGLHLRIRRQHDEAMVRLLQERERLLRILRGRCSAYDGWGDWICDLPTGHDGYHRDPSGAFWWPPSVPEPMDG